ncbi:MAG TPA: hypothetical protein VM285_07865 [Polyangia bacterium]|nr:hypothetical protein [Polyangia bacterium]
MLCLGRTGSSHLVALLDSHPEIRCYGEVLNATHRGAAPEGWIGDSEAADAEAQVERLLEAPGAAARGFKLPLNSLRDRPEIGNWLQLNPGVRVLRLRRRNRLALLVSRRMLRATLVSQSIYGSYGDRTVRIEPRECVRALERIEAEDRELDNLTAGHQSLQIEYDRLSDEAELVRVQRFLGVMPVPLSSPYKRLRKRSLAATVENWEEVSAALEGTRFEPLLIRDG